MADLEAAGQQDDYLVRRAISVARAHPSVRSVSEPISTTATRVSFEVTFEIDMPNAWRAQGHSPFGVNRFEPVRFEFNLKFPAYPPSISLRQDFSRDFAHVQPWVTTDGRPVPCIVEGKADEFYHQQGFVGILNQTAAWLEHASEGVLIDLEQGWEPARRDHLQDYIVADVAFLRGLVDRKGGHAFIDSEYLEIVDEDGNSSYDGLIKKEKVSFNSETVRSRFRRGPIGNSGEFFEGSTLSLVVWPGKAPSGDPDICDVYMPETVANVAQLRQRATLLKCREQLEAGLAWLAKCFKDSTTTWSMPLIVVLCARRPCNLIGQDSPIELLPYVISVRPPELLPKGDDTPVQPSGHRYMIVPELLARLSGEDDLHRVEWSLIGAGSLGSKLALHLARAGRAPTSIIDGATMAPHNAARHGLLPPTTAMKLSWLGSKASLLQDAIGAFGQKTEAIPVHIAGVIANKEKRKVAWSKKSWAVVNATASLVVRETLSSASMAVLPARVIEAILYAKGQVGVIAVEGPDRNPNLRDVMSEFYAVAQANEPLRKLVYGDTGELSLAPIGEGCGSLTMPMSDGRLSIMAAGMAEYLLKGQRDGLPNASGELLIGTMDELGMGAAWRKIGIPSVQVVAADNLPDWTVRIHPRALTKIHQEVGNWPRAETGGLLLGRISQTSKVINVVDVLDAPEDSTRSPSEFAVGTKGLSRKLLEYGSSANWALYCLGTWHSHLSPGGASHIDKATARALAVSRHAPSVLLITTPDRMHAVIADKAEYGE
jgi:hypothetical protein